MVDKILNLIDEKYPLSEKTIGDVASLKAKGMTFSISAYNASGIGHVSVMRNEELTRKKDGSSFDGKIDERNGNNTKK